MACVYHDAPRLPTIDLRPLNDGERWRTHVAQQIDWACSEFGFFYLLGHGIDAELVDRLFALSREFFGQGSALKLKIHMSRGGRAWRGYFPVGEELTSGVPDLKEGIYFGAEPSANEARTASARPLQGHNLFPDIRGFRETILRYLAALTTLGQRLTAVIAAALGCEPLEFEQAYTRDPTILLRIFNYPPDLRERPEEPLRWGVGEHTDYGLLTILKQDSTGGLQVKYGASWIDVPDVPDSFVCNVGDALELLTGGRYRSAPHRVRNASASPRISVPFFFDPSFDAGLVPVPRLRAAGGTASVCAGYRTYGEYLIAKVSRVFPELGERVLG